MNETGERIRKKAQRNTHNMIYLVQKDKHMIRAGEIIRT